MKKQILSAFLALALLIGAGIGTASAATEKVDAFEFTQQCTERALWALDYGLITKLPYGSVTNFGIGVGDMKYYENSYAFFGVNNKMEIEELEVTYMSGKEDLDDESFKNIMDYAIIAYSALEYDCNDNESIELMNKIDPKSHANALLTALAEFYDFDLTELITDNGRKYYSEETAFHLHDGNYSWWGYHRPYNPDKPKYTSVILIAKPID